MQALPLRWRHGSSDHSAGRTDGGAGRACGPAARAGQSLQEYLRGFLVDAVAKPSAADVIARARARVLATGARVDAEAILAARDAERR